MERLSGLDDESFKLEQGELQKTLSQWDDLPDRAKDAKSAKAFDAKHKKIRQRLRAAKSDELAAQLVQLRERAEFCAEVEHGRISDQATAEAQWSELPELPADMLKPLQQRLAAAWKTPLAKASAKTLSQNSDTSRDLCVALELAAEMDSPAEDSKRRMAMQVQRLSAALQGTDNLVSRTPRENIEHWYSIGPLDAAELQSAQQRIAAVTAKLFGQT